MVSKQGAAMWREDAGNSKKERGLGVAGETSCGDYWVTAVSLMYAFGMQMVKAGVFSGI